MNHNNIFLTIFIITILSSSFLYHFYEKKIRFGKKNFQLFLIISSILILFIFYLNFNNFLKKENNSFQDRFLEERSSRYKIKETPIISNMINQILFIGDSFADDLYHSVSKDSFVVNGQMVQKIQMDTVCYNLAHRRSWLGRIKNTVGTCEKQRKQLQETISKNKPKVIILVNHWKTHNYKFVVDAVKIINQNENTRLIIVGMRDTFNEYDQIFSRNTIIESVNKEFYNYRNNIEKTNNFLKKISNQNNIYFFQPTNICNLDKLTCDLVDEKTGEIKYLDYSHYTIKYSKEIMNEIKKILK